LTPHVGGKVRENLDASVRHWFTNIMAHDRGEPLPESDIV
jgi:phosphoglycerate dehydrogenase-like enzyme